MVGETRFSARTRLLPVLATLLVGVTLLFATGCDRNRTAADDRPSPELKQVVAHWDGGQVTLEEWLNAFRELANPREINALTIGSTVVQLTHGWVAERILGGRARDQGLDRDPAVLEKLQPLREESLVRTFLRREVDSDIRITKRDVERFYRDNQEDFMIPALYSYYRIFVDNEVWGADQARQRAMDCYRQLEAGNSFYDLVEEYSDSSEQKRDLLYGPFRPGENPAEIEQAILQTPVRKFSPVVELSHGYVILMPEVKEASVLRPLEKVRTDIHKELFQRAHKRGYEDLLTELMVEYRVTAHTELLEQPGVTPDTVVLEIEPGQARFTWGDFLQHLNQPETEKPAADENLFENYARRQLLLHHITQTGYDKSRYFRNRFQAIEDRVLADYLLELTVDLRVEPTAEEVKAFYDANHALFRRPARIEAWHLARKIRYPLDASEKDRLNAERLVMSHLLDVRRQIAERGMSFLTWADRFTEYDDRGYLGWRPMLSLPPAWVSVVARLEEGEISQPIRVGDTFELVLRGGLEEGGTLKYEIAEPLAREQVKAQQIAEQRAAFIEELLVEVQAKYALDPIGELATRLVERWDEPPLYWLDPFRDQ